MDRLERRGVPNQRDCVFCRFARETIDHLLVGCVITGQIWARFVQRVGLQPHTDVHRPDKHPWRTSEFPFASWYRQATAEDLIPASSSFPGCSGRKGTIGCSTRCHLLWGCFFTGSSTSSVSGSRRELGACSRYLAEVVMLALLVVGRLFGVASPSLLSFLVLDCSYALVFHFDFFGALVWACCL